MQQVADGLAARQIQAPALRGGGKEGRVRFGILRIGPRFAPKFGGPQILQAALKGREAGGATGASRMAKGFRIQMGQPQGAGGRHPGAEIRGGVFEPILLGDQVRRQG